MAMNSKDIVASKVVGFSHPHSVRFQEIDAAGIVYFPTIISYFHDAYAAFLADRGTSLPDLIAAGEIAVPIRHAEADFLSPIRFGETLELQLVGRSEISSQVSIYHRIIAGNDVKAVGETVHVFVERKTFRRTEPTDEVRRALESLPLFAAAHQGSLQ